jgi:hypothetical protein
MLLKKERCNLFLGRNVTSHLEFVAQFLNATVPLQLVVTAIFLVIKRLQVTTKITSYVTQ